MSYSFYLLPQKEKRRKKEGNNPFFSLQNERKMEKEREENTYPQGHEKQKRPCSSRDEQGLKTMRFYFEQNDKRFCSTDDKRVLLRQQVFLHFSIILQKAKSIILPSHSLSPSFSLQKKKRRRNKKRTKKRNLRRKRGRNFSSPFPFFFLKKEGN